MDIKIMQRISRRWSGKKANGSDLCTRWWQSQRVVSNINKLICGSPVQGRSQGLLESLRANSSINLPLMRAVSIGCGNGIKELRLIKQGVVETFDLYELSEERITEGKQNARKLGIEDRINFIHGDAFESNPKSVYDMVHWNSSLHHMFDVDHAILWSKIALKDGGVFYMDDFVGPTRFQWSDKSLMLASRVREILRETKYIKDYRKEGQNLSCSIKRPNPLHIENDDPSEAVDSSNIVKSIREHFPDASIQFTGGTIYHLVLADMLANFQENVLDNAVLDLLMLIDELSIDQYESLNAVALAIK